MLEDVEDDVAPETTDELELKKNYEAVPPPKTDMQLEEPQLPQSQDAPEATVTPPELTTAKREVTEVDYKSWYNGLNQGKREMLTQRLLTPTGRVSKAGKDILANKQWEKLDEANRKAIRELVVDEVPKAATKPKTAPPKTRKRRRPMPQATSALETPRTELPPSEPVTSTIEEPIPIQLSPESVEDPEVLNDELENIKEESARSFAERYNTSRSCVAR